MTGIRGAIAGSLFFLALAFGCHGTKREYPIPMGSTASTSVNSALPGMVGDVTAEGAPNTSGLVGADPSMNGELAPNPRALGAACVTAADCDAPGFCVDGVCCSSACTDLCAACNLPGQEGTCSAAPSDAACAQLTCPGQSTDCRQLDTSQLSLNCESFGKCRASADCADVIEPAGTPCADGAGSCDGNGACNVQGKASLGAACTSDGDCAEGHCVAGTGGAQICCDAACDGACQACSADGHCDAVPELDPRCPAVPCPPDNVCLDYPPSLDGGGCRAFGQCKTAQDCTGTQLLPAVECSCDTTGGCKLAAGTACQDGSQCSSGQCLATAAGNQVCCAASCGPGLFCSGNGSSCVACEGSAVTCSGNSEQRCNAGVVVATNCPNGCTPGIGCNTLPPVGFPCPGGQCADTAVCQQDVAGTARCCSRNCAAEGKVCSANGSCACAAGQVASGTSCLLQPGDPCTAANQCQPGLTCTDGVCCQEACDGACERCEAGTGACVAVAQGQQDDQCTGNRQCTGTRGDCRGGLRQSCSGINSGAQCVSGNCDPLTGDVGDICCAQSCTGARPFCKSDGSSCVQCETSTDCGNGCNTSTGQCNPLLDIGRNCGSSSQCANGASCLSDQNGQTRCCERNCPANGQVCDASGHCVLPSVGAGQQCAAGVVNCQGNFQCINGTCQLPTVGQGQACGAAAVCNGSLGLQCVSGVCNCSSNQSFAQGRCRLKDGQDCAQATDCASGQCTEWLVDADGDGIGSSANGFPTKSVCGDDSPANRPPPFVVSPGCRGNDSQYFYVSPNAGPQGQQDCCDLDDSCSGLGLPPNEDVSSNFFPGQTQGTFGMVPTCRLPRDANCDGVESPASTSTGVSAASLSNAGPCSGATTAADCTARSGKLAGAAGCGLSTVQVCGFQAGVCTQVSAQPVTILCL